MKKPRLLLEDMSFDAWMSEKDMNKLKEKQPEVFSDNTQSISNFPNYINNVRVKWNHNIDHDLLIRLLDRSKVKYQKEFISLLERLLNFVLTTNSKPNDKNSYYMVYKGIYFVAFFNSNKNVLNIRTVMGSQTVDCVNYFIDDTDYLD